MAGEAKSHLEHRYARESWSDKKVLSSCTDSVLIKLLRRKPSSLYQPRRKAHQLSCSSASIISYIILYHIISYHIISYHISYHIISYHINHIIYHIISYHIISYHIISYHIISYNRYLTLVLRRIVLVNTNLDQPT